MKLKIFSVFFAALMLMFSFSVTAASDVKIDLGDDFITFSSEPQKVAQITGQSAEEIDEYCTAEGIILLAVNEDNTKQVKVSSKKTKFSEQVGNISFLTEAEIKEIIAALIENSSDVRFNIEEKDSQKFIHTEQTLSDSGGEYSYISFLTVANESIYTLSFYTSKDTDSEYIWDVFESFRCDDFLSYNDSHGKTGVALAVIISVAALWILYTIIRDLRIDKKQKAEQINEAAQRKVE